MYEFKSIFTSIVPWLHCITFGRDAYHKTHPPPLKLKCQQLFFVPPTKMSATNASPLPTWFFRHNTMSLSFVRVRELCTTVCHEYDAVVASRRGSCYTPSICRLDVVSWKLRFQPALATLRARDKPSRAFVVGSQTECVCFRLFPACPLLSTLVHLRCAYLSPRFSLSSVVDSRCW